MTFQFSTVFYFYEMIFSMKCKKEYFHLKIFEISFFFEVLPLENEMRKPEDFGWVLNVGMSIISLMFIAMGLLGYVAFGEDIKGSVSLNLPDN